MMAGNPKDYEDINEWTKTLTKEDAERIYHDLNAGFNKAILEKRKAEGKSSENKDIGK